MAMASKIIIFGFFLPFHCIQDTKFMGGENKPTKLQGGQAYESFKI